jgi:hypothetical protein
MCLLELVALDEYSVQSMIAVTVSRERITLTALHQLSGLISSGLAYQATSTCEGSRKQEYQVS